MISRSILYICLEELAIYYKNRMTNDEDHLTVKYLFSNTKHFTIRFVCLKELKAGVS